MNKQWRMIIISGAVLVALAVVWLISTLVGGGSDTETTTTATVQAVFASPAAEISRIDVSNETGEYALLPLQTTDDAGAAKIAWRVEGMEKYDFSADRLDQIGSAAVSLPAIEEIAANTTDLEQYGLKDALATLTVTLKSGARHVIKIGKELPSGRGTYATLDDTGRVCSIASDVSEGAAYSLLDLLDNTTVIGSIKAEDVTRLTFERSRDSLRMTVNSIVTTSVNEDGEAQSSIEYKMIDPLEVTGNSFTMATIFNEPIAIKASEFIEMEPKDLTKYGLDKPQYTYTFATSQDGVVLKVGKQSDSKHYYAISDAMPVVFTFSSDLLTTADTKLITLISRSISPYSIFDVGQIEADLFGTSFVTGISLEKGKNVHDDVTTLTLDGLDAKIVDQSGNSLYIGFFSKLSGIMATGVDVEANPVNTREGRLTYQVEADTENNVPAFTKVIEFARRDDYTYYVFTDGEYSGLYVDGETAFTSENKGNEGIILAYRQMKYAIEHAVDGVFNTEEGYQLN